MFSRAPFCQCGFSRETEPHAHCQGFTEPQLAGMENDKEFMLAAVAQSGGALKFASKEMRNDPEVKAACRK